MEKQEFEGYTGVWRRMKSGAAVFIRDGEDIKTAVRRNFNGDRATKKLREYDKKDYEAFEREQHARSELNKALREKGELSADYEKSLKAMKEAKAEQNKIYNEKHNYINEMQDLARKQDQGIKIKQDEFDAIKKSGMTPKQKAKAIDDANNADDIVNSIRSGNLKYNEEVDGFEAGNLKEGYYVQFQDREKHKWEEFGNKYHEKTESATWARIWKDGEFVKEINDSKYGARRQAAEYLENAGSTRKQRAKAIDDTNGNDWREQIKRNNEETQKITAQLEKDRQNDYYRFRQSEWEDKYYGAFRDNERRNAKIKKEIPEEKYEYVDSYATYKDKFNNYNDGDTWTGKAYTNDEFMEHLTDANWHTERRMLEDANLTNAELSYVKDRVKLGKWSAELDKSSTEKLIAEAKAKKFKAEVTRKERAKSIDDANEQSEYLKRRNEEIKLEREKGVYNGGRPVDENGNYKYEAELKTRSQKAKAIDKANGVDKDYEAAKSDLLSRYTEDYGYDGNPEEAFVKEMEAVNYGHDNPYEMGKRLAEGGNYLIYNGDMVEYLAARGIKSNIDNAFDKYTDYIGKQSAKLYEEIKKRKK